MFEKTIVVTGGAGFVGSAVVRQLVSTTNARVVNVDKLTYASNLESLESVADEPRYHFVQMDICDPVQVANVFHQFRPDLVIHLAAETHVDRSIDSPGVFIDTNINGTFVFLEAARHYWDALDDPKRDASAFFTFRPMKSTER